MIWTYDFFVYDLDMAAFGLMIFLSVSCELFMIFFGLSYDISFFLGFSQLHSDSGCFPCLEAMPPDQN